MSLGLTPLVIMKWPFLVLNLLALNIMLVTSLQLYHLSSVQRHVSPPSYFLFLCLYLSVFKSYKQYLVKFFLKICLTEQSLPLESEPSSYCICFLVQCPMWVASKTYSFSAPKPNAISYIGLLLTIQLHLYPKTQFRLVHLGKDVMSHIPSQSSREGLYQKMNYLPPSGCLYLVPGDLDGARSGVLLH